MDLTPNYGLGKPLVGEDYDVGIPNSNMNIIDTELKDREDRLVAVEADIVALEAVNSADPVSIAAPHLTAAANWTIGTSSLHYSGAVCFYRFSVTRTNVALNSNSNGNIGNTTIGTWHANMNNFKPFTEVGISVAWGGFLWGGFLNAGGLYVNALPPNIALPVGGILYGTATYLRNIP